MKNQTNAPRRGEIVLVDLDPVEGHEQAGTRPALVLSADPFNATAELATILPITSKARAVRTRVAIQPPEGGLTLPSYVICEQVRTISIRRVQKRLGAVAPATMEKVEVIVRLLLQL